MRIEHPRTCDSSRIAPWPAPNLPLVAAGMLAGAKMEHSKKLNSDITADLRKLAHDLSNSIETVVQAAYLLNQSKLDSQTKKWARMIETAAEEAAQINRGIRELLRSQSGNPTTSPEKTPAKRHAS